MKSIAWAILIASVMMAPKQIDPVDGTVVIILFVCFLVSLLPNYRS